jgi:hypothetical protein
MTTSSEIIETLKCLGDLKNELELDDRFLVNSEFDEIISSVDLVLNTFTENHINTLNSKDLMNANIEIKNIYDALSELAANKDKEGTK